MKKLLSAFGILYMYFIAYMLLATPAFAQPAAETGQITGVVKDPDQAAVSGSR
jgi:hypothetical protein